MSSHHVLRVIGSVRLITRIRPLNTHGDRRHLPYINCSNVGHLVVQRNKSSSYKDNYKTIEALRRWNIENTKMFGPILKNSPIIPLGKKKKRKRKPKQQSSKETVHPLNDPGVENNLGDGTSGKNADTCKFFSQSTTSENLIQANPISERTTNEKFSLQRQTTYTDNRVNYSNHRYSSDVAYLDNSDEQVLKRIFDCKVYSSEDVSNIESLRSRLQEHPLPALPTVSGILAQTRSPENQFFLDRWKTKMIAELGEDGFRKYQSDMLRRGISLHACIQQYLEGKTPSDFQIQEDNKGHWMSIENTLSQITSVQALESRVTHSYLQYAGTYDCTAIYKETLCLIDWKTSSKPKPLLSNTFDYPLQVAAYIGALNTDPSLDTKVKHGLVVVAYGGGEPAHAHLMTSEQCEYYWKQWLQRLHQYWTSVFCPKLG